MLNFGDVSKLVAKAWKKLSDNTMAKFKEREAEDKERYNTEKAAVLAELERNPPAPAPVQTEEETPVETATVVKPAKKSGRKASKSPKAEKAAPVKKANANKKVAKGQGKNKKPAAVVSA